MSDTHDDPLPNPAALDELSRAFGDGSADEDAAADDDGGDPTAPSNPPLELHIVEQTPPVSATGEPTEPPEPPDGADVAEPAPAVVRIDDFGANVETVRAPSDEERPGDRSEQPDSSDPVPHEPTIVRIDGIGEDGIGVGDGARDGDDAADGVLDRDGVADPGSDTVEPGVPDAEPAVISIADENLPDPVYVEGNLERSGTRTIVFIEDDDTGDTVAPEADRDRRRGIEPRLRERRAAVKRAIGRKRLRWLILIAAIVIVGVGTLAVLGSNLFAIRAETVTVVGAVYTDEAELAAVIDDLVGTPILLADTEAAERRLEAIPWVDDVRVRTAFPHSLTIDVRERVAMTTYQGPDQRYRVLDRDGRVLDVLDGWPIAYVLLAGPDPVDLDAGEFAPQGYAAASELAKNLTSSVRSQVTSIEVTADGSRLSLLLHDGTEVRFGAASDLFVKLVRLETVLASEAEREPGVIDVSTREVTL